MSLDTSTFFSSSAPPLAGSPPPLPASMPLSPSNFASALHLGSSPPPPLPALQHSSPPDSPSSSSSSSSSSPSSPSSSSSSSSPSSPISPLSPSISSSSSSKKRHKIQPLTGADLFSLLAIPRSSTLSMSLNLAPHGPLLPSSPSSSKRSRAHSKPQSKKRTRSPSAAAASAAASIIPEGVLLLVRAFPAEGTSDYWLAISLDSVKLHSSKLLSIQWYESAPVQSELDSIPLFRLGAFDKIRTDTIVSFSPVPDLRAKDILHLPAPLISSFELSMRADWQLRNLSRPMKSPFDFETAIAAASGSSSSSSSSFPIADPKNTPTELVFDQESLDPKHQ